MKFSRCWAMPSSDTFKIPPIAAFIRRNMLGPVIIDPFARNSHLGTITNDLSPDTCADYHMDAVEFLKKMGDEGVIADTVLFDPPYSPRQMAECYQSVGLTTGSGNTQNSRLYAECRKQIIRLLRLGSRVLTFGWNSTGMGKQWFDTQELMLVCHGGTHNDTICIAQEYKPHPDLNLFRLPTVIKG